MANTFSIGVVIKGAVASAFRSAMGDSRRSLNLLGDTTRRLQTRQQQLTQAMTRYGQLGGQAARNLNSELGRVGQTLSRLEQQHRRLHHTMMASQIAGQQRQALMGQGLALGATTAAAVGRGRAVCQAVDDLSGQSGRYGYHRRLRRCHPGGAG